MVEIKDEMYYQVSGWMKNRLGLKGTKRDIYAIIYGFSQDGESEFNGSITYLANWLDVSRQTIISALQDLVNDNLIIKRTEIKNNITFNYYKSNLEILQVVKKLDHPSQNFGQGGSQKIRPNNNILNNNKIIKNKYGEYKHILLTKYQYDTLIKDYE